ncbi:MAG: hypothetical protein WDN45_11385 [Caulobacteraceae bacterium]
MVTEVLLLIFLKSQAAASCAILLILALRLRSGACSGRRSATTCGAWRRRPDWRACSPA